jgi:hypothetical protein
VLLELLDGARAWPARKGKVTTVARSTFCGFRLILWDEIQTQ